LVSSPGSFVTVVDPPLADALHDHYRIERQLGRGGMATVYLARDLKHDRLVAFKILHPELAATVGPERFLREIRTTARLDHPHIVPVLDSGEAAGQLWYTMPFVRGESLRDLLVREAQLPLEMALELTRQVASALDYAHGEGVVHRDLKPENILLADRQARVADFGVAKALEGEEGSLTATGLAVGTPAYMSPEQANGSRIDGRSDVYALGCVLYEMLAGEAPFTGRTPQAVIAKRFVGPVPSVRTVRPDVAASLESAIEKALATVPAARFATAGEFAAAVTEAATVRDTSTSTLSEVQRGRHPHPRTRMLLLGAAALALAFGGAVLAPRIGRDARKDAPAGAPVLVVLPFENLGRPEDAYFADGVTDEIQGKLAGLPGLQVIASSSAEHYKHTSKSLEQIARELGAQYLLVGRVRWEQGGGRSRVRVSPELVQVVDMRPPTTRWKQPFDADLSDVFTVQADIAGRVAQALGLALGAPERRVLAERPTQNAAAYDVYLQALEARRTDPPAAAAGFERAIALDSGFALAWVELALTHQNLSFSGFTPREQIERSKGEAEHALALQPKLPLAHYALGQYYALLNDYDRALAEYARGLEVAPNSVPLLGGVVEVDLRRGQWERALEAARRLGRLDPRSTELLVGESIALQFLDRFPEALAAADRALARDSLNLHLHAERIGILASQGDLVGARRALDVAIRQLGYSHVIAYLGRWYDIQWVLPDSAQAFLLRLRPSAMESDTSDWGLSLANLYDAQGDNRRARAYADTARRVLEVRLARDPQNSLVPGALCLAYGLAARPADTRRHCGAVWKQPGPDARYRDFVYWEVARAAFEIGDTAWGLSALEQAARLSGRFTRGQLRMDPVYAPLRGNPRFERLVARK
jgi:serine/threonine-protein kinase